MELTVSRGLQADLPQHFLGLFQREFRVSSHDNRQQLGSHLREAELLRRPAFIVFTVRLHGREARTTRRRMPSDRASMVNPAPAPPAYAYSATKPCFFFALSTQSRRSRWLLSQGADELLGDCIQKA